MDDEKHVHTRNGTYLPYLPNNMLYVTSWWFIDIRQRPFSLVVMYEYEAY